MHKGFIVCALPAFFAWSPCAHASILTYTYAGTVAYGTDYTGVFGASNTDLAGKTFQVVETFDTRKNRFSVSNGSTFSYQIGGTSYAPSAAGATATISIGGSAPRSLIGDYRDSTQNSTQGSPPSNMTAFAGYHSIYEGGVNDFYDESLQFSAYSTQLTYDYTKPFTLTTSTGAFSGSYSLSAFVGSYPDYTSFDSAFANFRPTSVTLTISNVPLPASLPMFGAALVGIATLGAALKRGRSSGVTLS